MPRRATFPAFMLCLVVLLGGCSIRTAGSPRGEVSLKATFDDVQTLVEGHGVQMADVRIGTVTEVRLVGYRAEVTMSIADEHRIPVGTTAEVAKTSLLGENFIRLTIPEGADLSTGPFMRDGAAFTSTGVQPDFEQVVDKAGAVIEALAAHDVSGVVDAYTEAFADKGAVLNKMIEQSATLVDLFADQRTELTRAIDDFARLGRSLAENKDGYADLPARLETASRALAKDRQKIIRSVDRLAGLAEATNDTVLGERTDALLEMLEQLDPVLASLGGSRSRITRLIDQLLAFEQKFPRAVHDGQLLMSATLRVVMPVADGVPPVRAAVPPGWRTGRPQRDGDTE
ncbi:MlaD family protein [Actinocorallia populi]|uniref:MlaD family protein n=1 Tax=Actinocorallia populi TaxID=2079200 RepID=UPI000D08BA05|nr:MCE family protein [Actinocorallia populi]